MSLPIVFMGSPEFALPTLRALAGQYTMVGVITQPDRPAGRGQKLTPPPVKLLARELGLPVIQPERLRQPEALAQLAAWQPALIVVAAFGQILRPVVLDLPRYGCINVHASLLPRWRGAAPIQAAILGGDRETGVTIMRMDAGVDTGPTLAQRALPVLPEDHAGSLGEKLARLGADLLLETLPAYLRGELQAQPQANEAATYAPMLTKDAGRLDFTQPAEQLARRVRAFTPRPGVFLTWNEQPLKIWRASAVDAPTGGLPPGRRTRRQGQPAIATGQGWLLLEEVQPAGKKNMPGRSFLAGARDWDE